MYRKGPRSRNFGAQRANFVHDNLFYKFMASHKMVLRQRVSFAFSIKVTANTMAFDHHCGCNGVLCIGFIAEKLSLFGKYYILGLVRHHIKWHKWEYCEHVTVRFKRN